MAFPGELNINYYKGDTYEFNIYPKLAGGSAMDLTDYTVQFKIAETRGSTTLIECYSNIPTVVGSEQFPNSVKCAITPAAGAQLDPTKTYYYDVEIKKVASPYPYVYTLLTGTISITDQVSRPA
jgi:hypothetical protein